MKIILRILALLAFLPLPASAAGPTSWSQSIINAPAAAPQTGDLVPFVHNGLTYRCTFGDANCFGSITPGGSTTFGIGGDSTTCLGVGGDSTTCLGVGGS